MNEGEVILSLYQELEKMPEQIILNKIRHFKISIEIFDKNYIELVHHLNIHNDSEKSFKLLSVDKRKDLHAYQREITRYLHNYVAAALSLIDHSRNHFNDLYTDNMFPEYQQEIDRCFKNNPLAVFIKDLRQYFQHYKIPGVYTSMEYINEKAEMKLLLPLKEVELFPSWHAPSKIFIKNQTNDINLIDLVNEYQKLVQDFYAWFIEKQKELHKNDQEKINSKVHEIRKLELTSFLNQLLYSPQTLDEFESRAFRMFSEDDLKPIKSASNTTDRLSKLLALFSRVKTLDSQIVNALVKLYTQ
jgi:hypothetical protein